MNRCRERIEHNFFMDMHYRLPNINLKSGLPIGNVWEKPTWRNSHEQKHQRFHQRPFFFFVVDNYFVIGLHHFKCTDRSGTSP